MYSITLQQSEITEQTTATAQQQHNPIHSSSRVVLYIVSVRPPPTPSSLDLSLFSSFYNGLIPIHEIKKYVLFIDFHMTSQLAAHISYLYYITLFAESLFLLFSYPPAVPSYRSHTNARAIRQIRQRVRNGKRKSDREIEEESRN